ncbi:MAG: filamentous hemagglutinin N-terminal domain-containing protein, partial [Syntrophorhabdales bacterium]
MIRRAVLALLGIMILPSMLLAGPTIPGFYGTIPTLRTVAPTQLPVLKPGGTVSGLSGSNPVSYTTNQLTINQIQSKAIIDWSSFDIGANASVYFNQQGNTSWVALNRIWDNSPSQIFGQLRADGQVYLINQNGILFGPGAQVNVHGLVASSLYIQDNDFLNGIMHFTAQDYNGRGDNLFYGAGSGNSATPGAVSSAGVIQTDALGSVFLIGPTVENSGVVTSFAGQIGLIAATEVQILQDPMASLRGTAKQVYVVAGPGTATNFENGWLIADTGLVGMYGQVVNQEGLIRSITAVQKPGYIELLASNLVSTGPNSLTSSRPSDSTETVEQSSVFQGGTVDVGGFNQPNYDLQGNLTGFQATAAPLIEHRGIIEAPSGTVNFRASQRAYFETGSKVDVSGVWVDETADANLAEQQLNSVELRDDYGQKSGLLKGLAVQFNALYGSAIGDVSGSLTTQNVTASQKATQGGTVTIDAGNGDVILKDGAQILFAGGGVHHGAGQLDTTTLLSGTKVYSISSAPELVQYDQVMDLQTVQYQRYGITKEFRGLFTGGANPVGQYSAAYTEGADAGSLRIAARTV